jgi:hypothetical protein
VVTPHPDYADPRCAFGSAQMICDALNLATANPDFVQAYSYYLCIVLDETNGPMGVGASVVWKTLCRPPNVHHRYLILNNSLRSSENTTQKTYFSGYLDWGPPWSKIVYAGGRVARHKRISNFSIRYYEVNLFLRYAKSRLAETCLHGFADALQLSFQPQIDHPPGQYPSASHTIPFLVPRMRSGIDLGRLSQVGLIASTPLLPWGLDSGLHDIRAGSLPLQSL